MNTRIVGLKYALYLIALAVLAGCVSTGKLELAKPAERGSLTQYKVLMVEVTDQTGSAGQASGQAAVQLENAIITQLRDGKSFEKVYSKEALGDNFADLLLHVTITSVRRVGSAARWGFGALAGRGKVFVNMDLTDPKSGDQLSEATAVGKTSGGTVFAGTTPQATKRVAEQVVKFVLSQR